MWQPSAVIILHQTAAAISLTLPHRHTCTLKMWVLIYENHPSCIPPFASLAQLKNRFELIWKVRLQRKYLKPAFFLLASRGWLLWFEERSRFRLPQSIILLNTCFKSCWMQYHVHFMIPISIIYIYLAQWLLIYKVWNLSPEMFFQCWVSGPHNC